MNKEIFDRANIQTCMKIQRFLIKQPNIYIMQIKFSGKTFNAKNVYDHTHISDKTGRHLHICR